MLNIYKIAYNNLIYGPGKRTVIWFRGCSIRCKDCINSYLWERKTESDMSVDNAILKIKNEGITLLGGEPLDQEDLEVFIDELKKNNKNIIMFTGYSKNQYDERQKRIASKCDVVISEPFIEELKNDNLYLRGSSNQIITINSNIFKLSDFEKPNMFEININDFQIESFGRNKNIIKELLDI